MIFIVLSEEMIFLFPKNMNLFYRRKTKDDLSRKKFMEMWYFLQMFRKDGLFKNASLGYDLSCTVWKDSIFFSRKHDIFSLDGKWKMIFLKKHMEIWYFFYIRVDVTNMIICPSAKKIKGDLLPQKYT